MVAPSGEYAGGGRCHEHVAELVVVAVGVARGHERDPGAVGAPGRLAMVVVAAGDLQRLGAIGERVDHEHVRPPVEGEADVVQAELERGDAPRRLLARRHVLVGAVAPGLGHPGDVGDPGRVGAPGEPLDAERVLAELPRLAARDRHDVELGLAAVLLAGAAQERQPTPVGREARGEVLGPVGEAARGGRTVGRHDPEVAPVGVVVQVDATDRDGDQPAVGSQCGRTRDAQQGEISSSHIMQTYYILTGSGSSVGSRLARQLE
jgi:hypothetical protein